MDKDLRDKPQKRPHCYICGSTENLTNDHIPPKGFFPPTDRENLIVAECCSECHPALSDDDLVMRWWFSGGLGVSDSGKWIYKHKAVPSINERPALKTQIDKHVHATDDPRVEMVQMPPGRLNPFIRRLTKAMLYLRYPEYDYSNDKFGVMQIPTTEAPPFFHDMIYERRGNGVFEVRHRLGIELDETTVGAWLFRFYEAKANIYMCLHGQHRICEQIVPKVYSEFHKLPKKL